MGNATSTSCGRSNVHLVGIGDLLFLQLESGNNLLIFTEFTSSGLYLFTEISVTQARLETGVYTSKSVFSAIWPVMR